MTLLYIVEGRFARAIVGFVLSVEQVPLYLSVGLGACPVVVEAHVLIVDARIGVEEVRVVEILSIVYVEYGTWHVFVVVRAWVVGIVVCKSR